MNFLRHEKMVREHRAASVQFFCIGKNILWKLSKKGLTSERGRSNIRHVRDREASGTEKDLRKKLQKVEKKVLTNGTDCGILTKLSRKTTAKHLENYIVHQQTSQVNS